MSEKLGSWLLEVRDRLTELQPHRFGDAGERVVCCLCLFVRHGELHTLLVRDLEATGSLADLRFLARTASSEEDPWAVVAETLGDETGLRPERVLRLGEFAERRQVGLRVLPCVAAIPPFEIVGPAIRQAVDLAERGGLPEELVPMPLGSLVETILEAAQGGASPLGSTEVVTPSGDRCSVQGTASELVLELAEVLDLG